MQFLDDDAAQLSASAPACADLFVDSEEQHKPSRVILLAVALSIATTLAMAGASEFFDYLAGGRYAEDILLSIIDRF